MATTTIRVDTTTRDELKKMVKSRDDSYDTVIRRLISFQKTWEGMSNTEENRNRVKDEDQRLMMLGLEVDLNNRLKKNPNLENDVRNAVKKVLEKINGNLPLPMKKNEFAQFIRAVKNQNATMAIILDQCHQMGRVSFST